MAGFKQHNLLRVHSIHMKSTKPKAGKRQYLLTVLAVSVRQGYFRFAFYNPSYSDIPVHLLSYVEKYFHVPPKDYVSELAIHGPEWREAWAFVEVEDDKGGMIPVLVEDVIKGPRSSSKVTSFWKDYAVVEMMASIKLLPHILRGGLPPVSAEDQAWDPDEAIERGLGSKLDITWDE